MKKSTKNTLRFILFIIAVVVIALSLGLAINTDSHRWQQFKMVATVVRWLVIPVTILLLPKILSYYLHIDINGPHLKGVRQIQWLMVGTFLVVELGMYWRAL